MGLFSNKKNNTNLLDKTLYTVPQTNTDITFADSLETTIIVGATGSGKSSGPGKYIAHAMLKKGYGFCVLCAKPDEKSRWIKYSEETKRSQDLVIFDKDSNLNFNFLEYEMSRSGQGAGDVLNASELIINLNEQIRILQNGNSKGDEKFWDNSLRRLVIRTILLLKITNETLTIHNIRKVIEESFNAEDMSIYKKIRQEATSSRKISETDRKSAKDKLDFFIEHFYFIRLLEKAYKVDSDDAHITIDYWINDFANLSEKTRSIVLESALGILEPFVFNGILRNKFSEGLSFELLPENIIKNKKIVIVDFPIIEFGLSGILANAIYKMTFQKAMERRNILNEDNPLPISLWIDEYQQFYSPIDSQFLATARSAWVANVFITQNINGIYQLTQNNQAQAKSLLANMNLKYFCSNSDYETNLWASNMIGEQWEYVDTINYDEKSDFKSKTSRLEKRRKVEIDEFTTLKTGRAANNNIVECFVFKAGKTWGDDNQNHALVQFNQ